MLGSYYKFPFEPGTIIQGKRHTRWENLELDQAIQDFIYLILITRCEELRSDYQFGCAIWNTEYEIPKKIEVNTWINQLRNSVLQSLNREKRIKDIKVTIDIHKIPNAKPDDYKKLNVIIKGYIPKLQRDLIFKRTLIFNPLSFR